MFSYLETQLNDEQNKSLEQVLKRRLSGEPTAYILGHKEFYGLDFIIDRNVLIPRPESELLVEKAINLARKRKIASIADVGTGSGAIAVSLAVNLPQVTVYAIDLSAQALDVARKNCNKQQIADRVILLQGNMLEPLPEPVDMIIANLPYVRASDLPAGGPLSYEPSLALDGGEDGLDKIQILCNQAGKKLDPDGCLLLEIGQGQAKHVNVLLKKAFPGALIEIHNDLAGIERALSLCLTRG
jgi:release factor glutamine methyltransferase